MKEALKISAKSEQLLVFVVKGLRIKTYTVFKKQ